MSSFVLRKIDPDLWIASRPQRRIRTTRSRTWTLKLLTQWLGVIVLLLCLPGLAVAQSLKIPVIILTVSGVADLASTAQFLTNGSGIREMNPAVNWIKNPALMLTFGAATESLAVILVTKRIAQAHPKWASVALYAIASIHAGYAINNYRLIHKHPGR